MNLQASIRIPRRAKDGETGDGIVNTVISYAKSESGTTPPITGWTSTLPTPTQGWYLWTRTVTTYRIRPSTTTYSVSSYAKDGEPGDKGEPGENGLPGQIPIQKEWVAGDIHRNNDTVIDYLYVRGATKGLSYWYKPLSTINGAEAPPKGGASMDGYKRIDSSDELAVDVLLAEEANVAGFIFKEGRLISVRGTVGGVDEGYSGQAGFVPNLILDGTEGDVKITGTVNALGGTIGDLAVEPSGRIAMYMPNTTQSRLTFRATDIPTLTSLLNTTVYGDDFTSYSDSLAIPQSTSTKTLIGSTYISQTGSTIKITGGSMLTLTCDFQGVGNATVGATLYLMRGSVKVQALASAFVMGSGIQNDVGVVESITLEGMQRGTYTLMLEVNKLGTQLTSGNATIGGGIKVRWDFIRGGIRNFLFGLNGFLSFFSNNHIYFTEENGLDVRGKTNMPGLLGSASVIGGQLSNEWGRITGVATYTGGYRVTISNMEHSNYTVQITSHTTNQWRIGTKTSSNFIILGIGNCDIAIMGNNY